MGHNTMYFSGITVETSSVTLLKANVNGTDIIAVDTFTIFDYK